jgi:uncharacterized metal-binding protein YceD (DUF177 family)
MSATTEFPRPVRIDTIGAEPRIIEVQAGAEECAALARRFRIPSIESLAASLAISRNGEAVLAEGRLQAKVVQSCVASGEPVPASLDEPFRIRFLPQPTGAPDEEVELSEDDCDTVFYHGSAVDVGEAVAESLALSLDPWPRAPAADEALKRARVKNEEEAGPFGALAELRDKLK